MKRGHSYPHFMFLLALLLMFSPAAPAFADGWLDPTFGEGGIVYTDFNQGADVIRDLVVQPDDKIVAVGVGSNPAWRQGFGVARYLSKWRV